MFAIQLIVAIVYCVALQGVAFAMPYVDDAVLVTIPLDESAGEAVLLLQDKGLSSVRLSDAELLTEGVLSIPVAKGASVSQAMDELESSDAVQSVQPDYLYKVMDDMSLMELLATASRISLPNDPLLSNAWGLQSINASAAWSLAYARGVGAKVGVAIVDAGFAVDHEDLAGNIPAGAPYNAYYASLGEEGEILQDVAPGPSSTSHGTHVAGIVAATANNDCGVAGVAYHAQIVPIRVYNYETGGAAGATTSALIKAYDYVIENKDAYNIRVVNMSLGVAFPAPFSSDDLLLSKIDDAFDEGIVTVAAAGNNASDGPYDCYPGDYETVVSVINLQTTSSIESDGSLAFEDAASVCRAPSSNRNAPGEDDKNISAPGTRVLSASVSSSYGFGRYGYLSGTSMACPHVAGVFALMFSVAPDLGAGDAVDVLYASARDIGEEGWDEEYGFGEVDAYEAVKMLLHDGWVDLADGVKGYMRDGSLVTGWMDLNGAKYWFGDDGAMATGWTDVMVEETIMHYYFRPSGNLARDAWATIDGQKHYFRPSGNMAVGWATIDDGGIQKKYYFDENGCMVTGWQIIEVGDGMNQYYFRPSGSMAIGWADIDGQKYFFRPSGSMATGFADVPNDGFKRYFDEDGRMLVGWQDVGENRYYFRASGAMQTGVATIDGETYTFNNNGVLQ